MPDIHVLLLHEEYRDQPPCPLVSSKGVVRKNAPSTVYFGRLLKELEEGGIIGGVLSAGASWWQGIVRVPTLSESLQARRIGVAARKGDFRRMRIS